MHDHRVMRFASLALIAACGSDAPGAGPDGGVMCNEHIAAVSFKTDVVPLVGHCGSELCHGGLGTSWPYAALVNVQTTECSDQRVIVKPGDPNSSYLIQKLQGIDMCMGVRMPKLGEPLPAADIQTLADWICEGAPNN